MTSLPLLSLQQRRHGGDDNRFDNGPRCKAGIRSYHLLHVNANVPLHVYLKFSNSTSKVYVPTFTGEKE